jgi:nitrogen-specific signal transduction histidine kinase/DNA-binding response OmpR family regulator
VLAVDIREQQRLCRELAAKNADLLQLNRLKDEFLACISHELKSPLTAVVGLSRLLQDEKIGSLNPRQSRYAHLIYQSGQQLMALVSDLLDLTRLESGQMKLNPVAINIEKACQTVYCSIADKYREKLPKGLPFTLEIEPDIGSLRADASRLQQMLAHLLDNAVKFTQQGGKFGIKVSRWQNWIAFTVWDTGIGISEDCQHLLFQKFQQLESPLTRQFEGTGLGLVLARRLAQAHGGEISFRSQVGKGSQFTLLLSPNPPMDEVKGAEYQSLALLVASTTEEIENLATKLADLGYCAAIARTGIEAVEKARQLQPAVIFLNPHLLFLSGWDALTLLEADARTQKIPTFITAPLAERHLSQGRGAEGFLSLPVESEALQQSLAGLARPSRPLQEQLTILSLQPLAESERGNSSLLEQLSQSRHRVLQVEDLEQAERIARVWRVDVLVLDGSQLSEPLPYLRSLGDCPDLAALPLVILDAESAAAANQVGGLSVFPCLALPSESGTAQFLQVLEIAASEVRSKAQ